MPRKKSEPKTYTCEQCGKTFTVADGHPRRYCSQKCSALAHSGSRRKQITVLPQGGDRTLWIMDTGCDIAEKAHEGSLTPDELTDMLSVICDVARMAYTMGKTK